MNENGQRLLELCCHHNLCIINTYSKTKAQHIVCWRQPISMYWHHLDLAVTRHGSVQLTRSYQNAECDTDHSLVCCRVKLQS